jgi:hypothetical protein
MEGISNFWRFLYIHTCREKLRHYNELDHELVSRLNRSYKFASRYMDQFVSPVIEVIAKFFAFIAVAFFAVIAALSAWDEDVLTVCFTFFDFHNIPF